MSARKKTGLAPGTVIYTGNKSTDKVIVHHIKYDPHTLEERELDSQNTIALPPSSDNIVDWYDVRGMQETGLIEQIATAFDVHPLVRENAVDVEQRPTFETYEKGNFLIAKALNFNGEKKQLHKEHVACYFRKGILITFQESESDLFKVVRDRIKASSGRIRQRGADYLTYAVMDVLTDNYYNALDSIELEIERLEEKIIENPESKDRSDLHSLKKEIIQLRKSVTPLREAISRFSKSDSQLIEESTHKFIRNLYEQTVQVMDTIDSYREMLNSLQDLFISEVSFKMNKVMQLLTLISVIFIPLTFLAGIYGMNFEYIPELGFKYGYFILLAIMAVVALVLIYLFKRKKWL